MPKTEIEFLTEKNKSECRAYFAMFPKAKQAIIARDAKENRFYIWRKEDEHIAKNKGFPYEVVTPKDVARSEPKTEAKKDAS